MASDSRAQPLCCPRVTSKNLHAVESLLLDAIFQQIFQLRHELLHVLEVHIDGSESHVRDFVELLELVHDHLADFGGGQLALGRVVHHAFDVVDDRFEFRRRHRALFARLQQSLQNFLAFEPFAAAIFFDDHVGNFIDALVGGEAAAALQAFAAAANRVAGTAFARIDYLVIDVGTERALHSAGSPRRIYALPLSSRCSSRSFSPSAKRFNSPSDIPSWMSRGTPTTPTPANVISQIKIAAAAAGSFSTPNMAV